MLKILDVLNKKNYIFICITYSLTLIVIGNFLIFNSISNIFLSNKENFSNNKYFSQVRAHKDFFVNKIPSNNNGKLLSDSSNISNLDTIFDKKDQLLDSSNSAFELSSINYKNLKKQKFIISILPLVVQANLKIKLNRKKLLEIKDFLLIHKTLSKTDQKFVETLAFKYKVNTANKHKIDIINGLLEIVDEIPNSIVLAQAANESGWGTSRFAKEYNALFGEYTFDTYNGIVPTERKKGEKYLIKFFPTIDKSIESYFINLNTHLAYKNFRVERQRLRINNLNLNPWTLVKFLKPYAKDKNYVKTIELIIKDNNLMKFDNINTIITKS